jgi:hypothetical protein
MTESTNVRYSVESTRCDCHPETCCCPDFTVRKGEEIVARGMDGPALRDLVKWANAGLERGTSIGPDHSWYGGQVNEDAVRQIVRLNRAAAASRSGEHGAAKKSPSRDLTVANDDSQIETPSYDLPSL